jgi:hypothetical protein
MVMPESHKSSEVVRVISRLIGAGARLWAEGDRLCYRGPAGLLTVEDARFIRERKADVMQAVSEGVELRCFHCGAIALAKPDERADPAYSDLWQGWCSTCDSIFSQARLLESDLVN